jgi:hypothetical protein
MKLKLICLLAASLHVIAVTTTVAHARTHHRSGRAHQERRYAGLYHRRYWIRAATVAAVPWCTRIQKRSRVTTAAQWSGSIRRQAFPLRLRAQWLRNSKALSLIWWRVAISRGRSIVLPIPGMSRTRTTIGAVLATSIRVDAAAPQRGCITSPNWQANGGCATAAPLAIAVMSTCRAMAG